MKGKPSATSKSLNRSLHAAKATRQDEFYTQLSDIEKELRHYARHFKGKTVLCNCDDPRVSNFFKYFINNFEKLGLKKVMVPDHYEMRNVRSWRDENGKNWRSLGNARWFTNLDISKRHEPLILFKTYDPDQYPKYDNLEAIEVARNTEIPIDYDGLMGVPDTFLDRHNPDQFELIGIPFGNLGKGMGVTKNHRGRTDIAITKGGKSRCPYSRIIIKRK